MGNLVSLLEAPARRPRCGLCYFELDDTSQLLLDEPRVWRSILGGYDAEAYDQQPLDAPLGYSVKNGEKLSIKLPKLAILQTSVARGCRGCAAIEQILRFACQEDEVELDSVSWDEEAEVRWRGGKEIADYEQTCLDLVVTVNAARRARGAKNNSSGAVQSEPVHREWWIPILVDCISGQESKVDHPFAFKRHEPGGFPYTDQDEFLGRVDQWLRRCESTHKICRSDIAAAAGIATMPKRLLELTRVNDSDPDSDEVSVRLVQDLETKEPYVCLTHRWGPTTPGSRTLQANLAERLGERGTLWESLPKTFQEAAIVTLYLGVRYIWIDSLCIIQDSAEDWKQQSALMCSIYNGARLTIAAAWADDCSRGLFRRPAPRSWEVAVPSAVGGDSPPRRYLFRRTPEHPVWDAKGAFMLQKETPLLSRSWVFQERLLSRRVVYFTRYEVVFECGVESGLTNDRGVKCQCGTNEFGHYGGGGLGSGEGGMGWRPKGDHLAALQVGKEFKGPGSDFAEISRYWHHMVSVYSGLDITKATDRLPAIGGIARQYGDAHAEHLGRYIAGTWENCLPHSLLWSCRGRPHGGDAPTHEAEYVGPTWSWISVRDQVDFSTGVARVYKDDLEIVGHHVHAEKGADQYGAILEGAALDCKAYLAPGTLEIEADDVDDARYRFIGAGECEQRFEPDRPLSRYVSLGSQIFCMKTGYVWDGKHLCLILRRLETGDKGGSEIGLGGTFERIGLVKNASKENIGAWFAGTSEKRTIRLV